MKLFLWNVILLVLITIGYFLDKELLFNGVVLFEIGFSVLFLMSLLFLKKNEAYEDLTHQFKMKYIPLIGFVNDIPNFGILYLIYLNGYYATISFLVFSYIVAKYSWLVFVYKYRKEYKNRMSGETT